MRKFDQELITLDSGLRILLTKTPGYYKSYIETTFLVGAENETDHKGICHLLEHSVFNGT